MINKKELVSDIAETAEIPKRTVKKVMSALVTSIHSILSEGGDVAIPGIGKFSVSERAARTGRNPKTGGNIDIPARKVPKFKASKLLKQAVEEKASQR